MTDEKADEIAVIENIQREDLTPLEEARAYQALMRRYGYTQEQVAEKVGKKRSTITNAVRLLKLPEDILTGLEENKITAGHARSLAGLKKESEMRKFYQMIISKGLSVRDIEKLLAKDEKKAEPTAAAGKPSKSEDILAVESQLMERLGTRVAVSGTEKRGKIVIDYYSLDDLNRLIELLGGGF